MIIKRCRELALRAPARVVFPDALDQRVLKAAQYLHQQGLATPILVANPFELRQFALSHGVAMDGLQVIDRMATSQCGRICSSLAGPRGRKNAAGCAGKTYRSADVRRRNGQRR